MKVATTARIPVPLRKIEPHHKTYERLTYIVNDGPQFHNYQVIPPPPPSPPSRSYNHTPPPPPKNHNYSNGKKYVGKNF
ncbi:hypothetical protein P8452_24527 [Trifolium repens]|nr:hypothetical protein P8452_24527 [Trifolium repens]